MRNADGGNERGVIGFRCPARLHELADAAAKAEGISKAAFARRALMHALEQYSSPQTERAA